MELLKGKVILVSGASSGIGEGVCEALVKCGMKVVGIARRGERLNALGAKLAKEVGEFHGLVADVSIEADILNVFDYIRKRLGTIHAVVNNAAVVKKTSLIDGSEEDWKSLFNINVIGLCTITREAIRLMKETEIDGYVIHINSILGHDVPTSLKGVFNVYPATKYAVTALSEILRHELFGSDRKIRVTSLSPGIVETELAAAGNVKTKAMDAFPRIYPKDIAETIIFLLTRPTHVEITEITIRPLGETI